MKSIKRNFPFVMRVLLVALPLSGAIQKTGDEEKQALNIVFIGDSITEGGSENDAPPVHTINYLRLQTKGVINFSNQGHSGFTTVDFLPGNGATFKDAEKAADSLQKLNNGLVIFSVMLGTNDSAEEGPNGSPVSPENYKKNMETIINQLLTDFPGCHIILHHATWYSSTTYNSSRYLAEGLERLQSYFPQINATVKSYSKTHPGQVFTGDTKAFDFFKANHKTHFITEHGQRGVFYLHPNNKGAKQLGELWGKAIYSTLESKE